MDLVTKLAAILGAASMMLTGTLEDAAPQHNINGTLFLVNRQYTVSDSFEPAELTEAQVPGSVREMRPDAAAALEEMYAACKEETGCQLISVSGYRAYTKQEKLYKAKLQRVNNNVALAQEYVAPPGASEHHLGLAMDIGQQNKSTLNEKFAETEGGIWARENCWRFGFILRYDEDWESVTGYKYEPWHFRYVGKELAKEIHDSGVPFETWLIGYRAQVLQNMLKEAGK